MQRTRSGRAAAAKGCELGAGEVHRRCDVSDQLIVVASLRLGVGQRANSCLPRAAVARGVRYRRPY